MSVDIGSYGNIILPTSSWDIIVISGHVIIDIVCKHSKHIQLVEKIENTNKYFQQSFEIV